MSEEKEIRTPNPLVDFQCPACKKYFPRWYWGTGFMQFGTSKNTGLAAYNFRKHKQICFKKHGWIFCDECCYWFSSSDKFSEHLDSTDCGEYTREE